MAATPATIRSLRGGMNNDDPPVALGDTQSVLAENVELVLSMLGERRRGATSADLTDSALTNKDQATLVALHTPTENAADAEVWVFGKTSSTQALCRKATAWSQMVLTDPFDTTDPYPYRMAAVSFNGKLFVAGKTGVDRLHCWDGTTWRRTGLAAPSAAPTAVDVGSGAFSTARYYRVRAIEMSGSTILRRSEPSPSLTHTPSSAASVTVTRPTLPGEGETHWELEASSDDANYYVIATTAIATTTASDAVTTLSDYTLSADIGDYTYMPSVDFLAVDDNRLIGGVGSRVYFTVKTSDTTGVGNDERIPIDIDSYLDLNPHEGGSITNISRPQNGTFLVTKDAHIYKFVRTGDRTDPYEAVPITKEQGAVRGSLVDARTATGQPAIYWLDPVLGPMRYGPGGLLRCGKDLMGTWQTFNPNAIVPAKALWIPAKQQIRWWIATGTSDYPDTCLVLHVNRQTVGDEGLTGGFTIFTGGVAAALSVALVPDNFDGAADRSATLVPVMGRADAGGDVLWRLDEGDDDNGTDYTATILTKPYMPTEILHDLGVMAAVLVCSPATGVSVQVTVIADFGKVEKTAAVIDLTPVGSESLVIGALDDLSLSEARAVQFRIEDGPNVGYWEAQHLAWKTRAEGTR